MNKLIALISILCLVTVSQIAAQSSVWKVTKDSSTIYLGGSIHLLRKTDYPLPKEFDTAYSRSSKILFETDISGLQDPEFAQKLLMKCMYTDTTTLQSVLTKKNYDRLAAKCAELMIPIENLQKFNPAFVSLLLITQKLQKLGVNAEGVDQFYFDKAIQDKKPVEYFETIDEQIDMIAFMGKGNENEYTSYSLDDFDKLEKEFEDMVLSWKTGSSTFMKRNCDEMEKLFPDIYKQLLADRNNNWMPVIEKLFLDTDIEFVVVGALHFYGNDGVIKMLKEKGYTVEQLKL